MIIFIMDSSIDCLVFLKVLKTVRNAVAITQSPNWHIRSKNVKNNN